MVNKICLVCGQSFLPTKRKPHQACCPDPKCRKIIQSYRVYRSWQRQHKKVVIDYYQWQIVRVQRQKQRLDNSRRRWTKQDHLGPTTTYVPGSLRSACYGCRWETEDHNRPGCVQCAQRTLVVDEIM